MGLELEDEKQWRFLPPHVDTGWTHGLDLPRPSPWNGKQPGGEGAPKGA